MIKKDIYGSQTEEGAKDAALDWSGGSGERLREHGRAERGKKIRRAKMSGS